MSDELALIDEDGTNYHGGLEGRLRRVEQQLNDFGRTLRARVVMPGIENGEERMQILERRGNPQLGRLVGTITGIRAHLDTTMKQQADLFDVVRDLIERVTKLERNQSNGD